MTDMKGFNVRVLNQVAHFIAVSIYMYIKHMRNVHNPFKVITQKQ